MTTQKYIKAEAAWLDMVGLKEGDKVRVNRIPLYHEFGWRDCWFSSMTCAVGQEAEFCMVTDHGINLKFKIPCGLYIRANFPFFVLDKVSSKIPGDINISDDYSVTFKEDKSIEIGCQNIPFDLLKKIYETAKSVSR